MFDDYGTIPKMSTWIGAALATAFFAVVAYYLPDTQKWQWLRLLSLVLAIFFAGVFLVAAIDWLWYHTNARIKEYNTARVAGALELARQLHGLTREGLDIVARHDQTKVLGRVANDRILWTVRCPNLDVPLDFIGDYLSWSQQTQPFLWPIDKAYEVGKFNEKDEGWTNAERLATAFTALLVDVEGLALPAVGSQAAKLKVPIGEVAQKFGIELPA